MPPPLDILMEDVGWWVRSGRVLLVTQEGPPLLPFKEGEPKVEVAGAMAAEDSDAMVG